MDNMENEIIRRVAGAVATTFIIAFVIMAIGTAVLPALLARLFGWPWLLAYPGMLVVFTIWARSKRQ